MSLRLTLAHNGSFLQKKYEYIDTIYPSFNQGISWNSTRNMAAYKKCPDRILISGRCLVKCSNDILLVFSPLAIPSLARCGALICLDLLFWLTCIAPSGSSDIYLCLNLWWFNWTRKQKYTLYLTDVWEPKPRADIWSRSRVAGHYKVDMS